MFELQFSLINGLSFGLEHITFEQDEEEQFPSWGIVLSLVLFRFLFLKWPTEE